MATIESMDQKIRADAESIVERALTDYKRDLAKLRNGFYKSLGVSDYGLDLDAAVWRNENPGNRGDDRVTPGCETIGKLEAKQRERLIEKRTTEVSEIKSQLSELIERLESLEYATGN